MLVHELTEVSWSLSYSVLLLRGLRPRIVSKLGFWALPRCLVGLPRGKGLHQASENPILLSYHCGS